MQPGFAADTDWGRGALLLLQHGETRLEVGRCLDVLQVALDVSEKAPFVALLRILDQSFKPLHSVCLGQCLPNLLAFFVAILVEQVKRTELVDVDPIFLLLGILLDGGVVGQLFEQPDSTIIFVV